jgi:arylsulfatase A-like enzyme
MLPTLLGRDEKQQIHEYLYWELAGQQAVRMGDWKAARAKPNRKIELYNLKNDISEQRDIADEHPDIVAKIADILANGRTESDVFPLSKPKSSSAIHRHSFGALAT